MIDELKRFLLVAKEGNLTKTAERIFITQSALTQSMHRLEKELDTKLFTQKGKQLQLTEDGKSLFIIGEKIVELWEKAHDPYTRKVQTPTYTVGMFDNVALRLAAFLKQTMQNDAYNLELTIDSSGKLLTQLQLGTLDAALCVMHKASTISNQVTLLQTYSEKLVPVSSKIFSESIADVPFILYNRGSITRRHIDETFRKYAIQPITFAESTSVTFMRELALLGCGVALLPENFIKQDLKTGRLKQQKMNLNWRRDYGLFIQKDFTLQNPFIIEIQKAVEELK